MSEKELIIIDDSANALEIFSGENGLNVYVEEARAIVLGFEHNLESDAGRSKTKSLAAKVSKLKTKLDGLGKDLVSGWKTQAKAVDINRKAMREQLDDLKVIARKPLTDWENKKIADAADIFNKEQAEKLTAEKESDHEFALLLDEKINRDIAEEKERIAKEESDRLARVAAEQEENQKRLDREAKIKAEADAKAAIEKAAKDQSEAEQRAKDDADLAAEKARQAEIDRQQAIKDQELAEQEKRESNKRHIGVIRKQSKECLMNFVDEDTAKKIVMAIHNNEITNISIHY